MVMWWESILLGKSKVRTACTYGLAFTTRAEMCCKNVMRYVNNYSNNIIYNCNMNAGSIPYGLRVQSLRMYYFSILNWTVPILRSASNFLQYVCGFGPYFMKRECINFFQWRRSKGLLTRDSLSNLSFNYLYYNLRIWKLIRFWRC